MAADDATARAEQPPPPPPPPSPPRERKWLPTFGVLLVMAFVSLGGYVFAGETGAAVAREPRLGDPVQVVEGLTIRPLQSWQAGDPLEINLQDVVLEGVRLSGGAAVLDVSAAPGASDPAGIWNVYIQGYVAAEAEQLRISEELEPFTTDQGIQGVRGSYLGVFPGVASPIEGEVAAIVMPDGLGVIAEGWAPEGQLLSHLEDIRAMTATLERG